jgi:TonB family protein
MANSAPYELGKRYVRPGELDASLLQTHSVQKRPEVRPNPNLKPPTPSTGTVESKAIPLRQSIELNPNLKSPAPTTGIVNAKSLQQRLGVQPTPNNKTSTPTTGIFVSKSPEQRPAVQPNRSNKTSTPPTRTVVSKSILLRQSIELNRKSPTPLTGKGAISGKRVAVRFALLPDQKLRWGRIGLSAVGQLVALGLLLLSPVVFPQTMRTALKFDVVELMQPVTEIPAPPATPPPPPRPKIKPKTPPRPPELKPELPELPPVPQLSPRQPHVFLMLKPELRKVHTVEEKPVELKPVLTQTEIVLKTNEPKPPREDVKIGNLSSGGSPAPATVAAPANKVQTGGFGDPNGISGPGNPNRAGNINQAGSPQLPGGPGSGNGSGGAQGVRGTVASEGPGKSAPVTGGVTAGVDILSKPNPVYSNEGRTLRMEGDVVLEVVFLASGQVQVTRVVSGLGHGLDEAAILAAKQIHFRPAKRDGLPVDSPARVRIEFRLGK